MMTDKRLAEAGTPSTVRTVSPTTWKTCLKRAARVYTCLLYHLTLPTN
jgi:hypothetical protein